MDWDTHSKRIISPDYFQTDDVVALAKDLIGKIIFTKIQGQICAAIISETEAYAGESDKASHAYNGRRTKRTETMYMEGGHAYIYLIYGLHHLLNIVSHKKNIPNAVLIRGGYPIVGMDSMESRLNKIIHKNALVGPGRFSKAMGIQKDMDALKLGRTSQINQIWLENHGLTAYMENDIIISKRIGIDYAEEDADLPYRFHISHDSESFKQALKQISKPIDY